MRIVNGRGEGGQGGRVSSVFQINVVAFRAKEVKTKLLNLETGVIRLVMLKDCLFIILNKNVKSQLCTADRQNSLHCRKYCPDKTTDLISISKLGKIGYRVSF